MGDEPDPWHCTARVRTLETEGVRNLNLGSAYGGVMRVHSMRHGPGTGKCGVPLPCGKYAGPSIRRCALSDETSRVTLPPEMGVCQGPLVYGLWKARLFLQDEESSNGSGDQLYTQGESVQGPSLACQR